MFKAQIIYQHLGLGTAKHTIMKSKSMPVTFFLQTCCKLSILGYSSFLKEMMEANNHMDEEDLFLPLD